MTRYFYSDTHFDHKNIIKYCDRPFNSLDEMNTTLINNWNDRVEPGDVVYFLGDLAMASHGTAVEFAEQLNGDLLVIDGNHDDINPSTAPFPVLDNCTLTLGKYNLHCTHRPENAPADAEWTLHGHHHNNHLDEYPFINTHTNTINISCELLEYRPITEHELKTALNNASGKETLYTPSSK